MTVGLSSPVLLSRTEATEFVFDHIRHQPHKAKAVAAPSKAARKRRKKFVIESHFQVKKTKENHCRRFQGDAKILFNLLKK